MNNDNQNEPDSNMQPTPELPPVDPNMQPPQQLPPVDTVVPPVQRLSSPTPRSDQPLEHGSAAAVKPTTPAVATRARTQDAPRRRRGDSPGGTKGRSRSPRDEDGAGHQRRQSDLSDHVQLMQLQINQLVSRLAAVEAAHASGHDAIASFADRLVGENAKLDQRLIDLKGTTEVHLTTIEGTFQRCNRAMEELKIASQTATSAAAHAMASSPNAGSSSTVTPGFLHTDLALLRAQLDTSSAVQLVLDERIGSLDDRFTAKQLEMQSAVAEITGLALGAATGIRNLDDARMAADAKLRGDIEITVANIKKELCRCPAGCPGTASKPPGIEPEAQLLQPSEVPASDPFQGGSDPWKAKTGNPGGGAGGGGGDGGPSGGGSGGPIGPGGPDHFGIGSDDGDARTTMKKLTETSKNPFDTKDAKDNLPRYDGKVKREYWRKMVSYYLYSKNVDMGPLLKWAEQQKEPITGMTMAEAEKSEVDMAKLDADPEVLSHHLWGFLNISLTEDAWEIFDNTDAGSGLEVWRLVNMDTTQKTEGELMEMEDLVQNPRRLPKLTDITKGIVAWDNLYKEYREAGGEKLTPAREVNILAKMLPGEFKQHAL